MREDSRDKLINDLNLILKDHFDYVSIGGVVEIVDKLIKNGWKFKKEIRRSCCEN